MAAAKSSSCKAFPQGLNEFQMPTALERSGDFSQSFFPGTTKQIPVYNPLTHQQYLTGSPQGIELRVHDSGAEFDAKAASNGHGLGLTSMRERLRLVDGRFSIDSKPNQGTTVFARVPLSAETATASSAA
jgi:hypothetical protein